MRELKIQFSSALLVVLTVAALVSAGINFQQQNRFKLPEDGIIWVDRAAGVEAISLSLDGATAASHDALRGVPGCFERTLEAARTARHDEFGDPPQYPAGTDYGDFRHQQEPDPVRRRRRVPPFYEERERRAPRKRS